MSQDPATLRFGFWKTSHDLSLPEPQVANFDNKATVALLGVLESTKASVIQYRGFSCCRICKELTVSREFVYETTNYAYHWPGGYSHYLEVHHIEPHLDLVLMLKEFYAQTCLRKIDKKAQEIMDHVYD